jgi:hypothetical protein
MESFFVGGDKQLVGTLRFKHFFPSGGELDFRSFDGIEEKGGGDDDMNSLPIFLHASAINNNGFSFCDEY